MPSRSFKPPAPLVAIVNWLVPGAGYFLIGQKARGATIGITILLMFVAGILIGGIHVVDPPSLSSPSTSALRNILEKPWYIGQFMSGIIGLVCGKIGPGYPASHARLNDIGTLYTAVAGMLNLMGSIDAAYRATFIVEAA